MSVSLVEVMAAASQRLAPLSGECAGHAVLAAADQLLAHPRLVGAADVLIEESGAVRLAHGLAADARGCDEALRELLDGLLTVAHSGGAGLVRVGRRAATGDLEQLVKELEVALIPANRAAARRSLARLYRETSRARDAGNLDVQAARVPERRAPAAPPPRPLPAPPRAPALGVAAAPVASGAPVVSVPVASGAPDPATRGAVSVEVAAEPFALTQIRWATAPRGAPAIAAAPVPPAPQPEAGLVLEVDVDLEITPVVEAVAHTQALPKVEPRSVLHQTAPLPPVSSRPRVAEHETPLEPVLSRRHAGPPGRRREFPDIHETPYLGTQVSAVPVYDEGARAAWPLPTQELAATAPAEWETDESTTDPAPVVAWGAPDHDAELAEAPLADCPALAVAPRITPLPPKEPRVSRSSDVEELVERFRIAEPEPDTQLARSLKQLAGITATPPPVLVRADESAAGDAAQPTPESSGLGSPLVPNPTVPVAGS